MTDWVDDLDKLKRRPPSKNVAQTIVRVMVSASDDRTTAILAAALVETSLIGPIALVTRSPNLEKEFWLPRRLLSLDFKDRISKASAVGPIGPNTTNNLEVIDMLGTPSLTPYLKSSSRHLRSNVRAPY